MQRRMIYHHPLPVQNTGLSGSRIRPFHMYEAFKNLGYQVELVTGYIDERRNAIEQIKKEISQGYVFDFVYSESSTMPTALTEKHHIPLSPFLDFNFFRWARKHSVPVGLFYRDIHWKFDLYRDSVAWYKQMVTIPFYWFDWFNYFQAIDHLFLPSLAMKKVLPTHWPEEKVSALPPGCIPFYNDKNIMKEKSDKDLRLIYVGGIKPPLYNLKAMIDIVSNLENITLTICCRIFEWEEVNSFYGPLNHNIRIIHANGDELTKYYFESDLFALFWEPHAYLDFAVPVKVFEALGYGIPIITTNGTEAARFILKEGIGWAISERTDFRNILLDLRNNRNILAEKKKYLQQIRTHHTWEERAKTVADTLNKEGL